METIEITKEPIELCKLLKFAGITDSGSVAKDVIKAGVIKVNGEVEKQMRKQIFNGDIVELEGQKITVKLV